MHIITCGYKTTGLEDRESNNGNNTTHDRFKQNRRNDNGDTTLHNGYEHGTSTDFFHRIIYSGHDDNLGDHFIILSTSKGIIIGSERQPNEGIYK